MKLTKLIFAVFLFMVGAFSYFFAPIANASHSWGNYHWARTGNLFTLKLGDNLSQNWDSYLITTSSDWNISSVLDTNIVPGLTNPKNCRPKSGRVDVCNSKYGYNGWLGIAQIWVSGSHITQGVVKVNDTYFNSTKYNTSAWKNLVLCQEVGHTLGLDHQDEDSNNSNLDTCMDYTTSPTSNQHPNMHDYDELETIYAHLDDFTTLQSFVQNQPFGLSVKEEVLSEGFSESSTWGRQLRNNNHVALYERDLDDGKRLFTFVIWAQKN